ncbi:MAG: hypothetical protein ABJA67_17030 [Chthonomonadales bacterium]
MVAFALIGIGYQEAVEGAKFRKPVVISYDQIKKALPEEGLYTIEGAEYEVDEAVYSIITSKVVADADYIEDSKKGSITEAYLPLHKVGEEADLEPGKKASLSSIVLKTKDPEIISLLTQLRQLEGKGTAETESWAKRNVNKLSVARMLTGMIRPSSSTTTDDGKAINQIQRELANNYMVIEEGNIPSVGGGFLKLGGGIVAGVLALLLLLGRFMGEKKPPVIQV